MQNSDLGLYADALNGLRRSAAFEQGTGTETQALVIRDASQAAQAADTGWIWQYQPWHVGTSSPQFTATQRHVYERIRVRHKTKVAFFVGLKELTPYRTDYGFDDDTPEYVEHFLDLAHIDSMDGVDWAEGAITANSTSATVVSGTFPSYKDVRGLQFATQETDSIQVFKDPNFVDPLL